VTRIILTVAASLLLAKAARAEDHTASWFAAHPADMNAVLDACRDDPGHTRNNPNCANAEQGMLERDVAEGKAAIAHQQAMMDAQQDAAWRADQRTLVAQLKRCNTIPVQQQWWPRTVCPRAFAVAKQILKEEGR
jgi:hypothetical protein